MIRIPILITSFAVLVTALPAFAVGDRHRGTETTITSNVGARTSTISVSSGFETGSVVLEGTKLLTDDGYSLETRVVADDARDLVIELVASHPLTGRTEVAAIRVEKATGQRTQHGSEAVFRLMGESRDFALVTRALTARQDAEGVAGRDRIATNEDGSGCLAATFKLAAASAAVVVGCTATGPVAPIACIGALATYGEAIVDYQAKCVGQESPTSGDGETAN